MSIAASKVLVIAAVWAAPMGGGVSKSEWHPQDSFILCLPVVFFVHLVNTFLECSVKNYLSNLNSVNKQGVHM